MDLHKKLDALKGEKPSTWKEKAVHRKDNREWLKRSQAIAVRILDDLRTKGMSQKALAEQLQVTPQQISKILKGEENLTLQTITQIEIVLGIKLIYLLSTTHTQTINTPLKTRKSDFQKTITKKADQTSANDNAPLSESLFF